MRCIIVLLLLWASVAAAAIPREAYRYQRDLTRGSRVLWGMDAPVATFAAQIHQESGWRPDARSRYATGLAQFTPATADWISRKYQTELGENQPFNPSWALRALVRYDKHLYDRIVAHDTQCDRVLFALSDYNGGPGWRIKRQSLSDRPGEYEITSRINPGIRAENQRENEEYPRRIVRRWQPEYMRAGWGLGVC